MRTAIEHAVSRLGCTWLGLACLWAVGCGDAPKHTWDQMVTAAQSGDVQAYRACYSRFSRQWLEEGEEPVKWRKLMKATLGPSGEAPTWESAEAEKNGVVVAKVTVRGVTQQLGFRREDNDWRVSLADSPDFGAGMAALRKQKQEEQADKQKAAKAAKAAKAGKGKDLKGEKGEQGESGDDWDGDSDQASDPFAVPEAGADSGPKTLKKVIEDF